MVDIQTISVVIAAASVVVGVVTFIVNSRKEARQREVEFLFQRTQSDLEAYYRAWFNVVTIMDWKNLDELNEKYQFSTHPEERSRFNCIGHFFNSIGLLLKEKVVNPELLFTVFTPALVLTTWRRYESTLKEMRIRSNDPILWSGFEYLGNEVKKRYPEVNLIAAAPEWIK